VTWQSRKVWRKQNLASVIRPQNAEFLSKNPWIQEIARWFRESKSFWHVWQRDVTVAELTAYCHRFDEVPTFDSSSDAGDFIEFSKKPPARDERLSKLCVSERFCGVPSKESPSKAISSEQALGYRTTLYTV
jgi:hypothetical protein